MKNEEILKRLNQNPVEHAWAIQDLTTWPERSKIFAKESPLGLSYLLMTGHPSQARGPAATVIMSDEGGELESLLGHLPDGPVVIRETPADVLPKLSELAGESKTYLEQRMEVTRDTFKVRPSGRARTLTEADAPAMAAFYGAPPQAAHGFINWIRGATIMGAFEEEKLVALGTTVVKTPAAWVLAEIITLKESRGKGYATEVTSALTALGLEHAPHVSLTVMKDNAAAIKVYSKIGYQAKEDRVWISRGMDSRPSE